MSNSKYEHNSEIITKLHAVIYEYKDKISVAEAVGLLEIAKLDLLEQQRVTSNVDKST